MSPFSLIKYLQFSWPITIILIVFFQIICALFPDVPRIIYAGTRISYVKRSRFFVSLFQVPISLIPDVPRMRYAGLSSQSIMTSGDWARIMLRPHEH